MPSREPHPFAINTYSYTLSHPATDCLRHLAAQGNRFRADDVPGTPLAGAHRRRAPRDLVEAQGLRIMSLNTPNIDLNITAAGEEMRRQTLGLMHGILELAGDLDVAGCAAIGTAHPEIDWRGWIGLRNVLTHGYHRRDPPVIWRAAGALAALVEVCKGRTTARGKPEP